MNAIVQPYERDRAAPAGGRPVPAAVPRSCLPRRGLVEVQRRPGGEPRRADFLLRLRGVVPAAAPPGHGAEHRAQEQPVAARQPAQLRAGPVPGDRPADQDTTWGPSPARACRSSSAPSCCCSAPGAWRARCRTRCARSGASSGRSARDSPFSQLWAFALVLTVGIGFIVTTFLSGLAGGAGHVLTGVVAHVGTVLISLVLNVGVFWLSFRIATAWKVPWRDLRIGAAIAAVCWQVLQVVGGYVVSHQLHRASELYGTFGIVLGLLAWLLPAGGGDPVRRGSGRGPRPPPAGPSPYCPPRKARPPRQTRPPKPAAARRGKPGRGCPPRRPV